MGILDRFKKKEEVPLPTEYIPEERLPEELQRFRMQKPPPVPEVQVSTSEEYPSGTSLPIYAETPELPMPPTPTLPEPEKREGNFDRIDMILQRLETIDTRLKLIEERLRR